MSLYKKIKIPKKNLPVCIDSHLFKTKWLKALTLEEDCIVHFLNYLESFYLFVNNSLRSYKEPNYFLLSILPLIDSSFDTALKKLKIWLMNKNIAHESKVIIFQRLKNIKKVPKKARPLMAEYYFVLDFKWALSKEIKKIKINKNNNKSNVSDYYYMKDPLNNLTNWEKYLLELLFLGYNNSEISEITQLSRKTIIKERKKLYVYV